MTRADHPTTLDQLRRAVEFAERYHKGDTLDAIGKDYGLTRERVRQVLRKYGVESLGLRQKETTVQARAQIEELAAKGVFVRDIAAKVGVSECSVYLHLSRCGIAVPKAPYPRKPEYVARDAQIAADYQAGMKLRDLCAKYGIQAPAIYHALNRQNVSVGRKLGRPRKAA